ncbi:hypothetical protein K431DRAFT_299491 [Polychaeton citri CBS 116435]|uniref:DUF8035 domain-containing protein n=1 Tax=Polychaeton citri CBS 116435 TaxID=1314669 RepID=A0A9P4QIX5_9PEZI|nr:hypothetical protein K431DRAFT_299491 [Polychaeton citri CBS 116435]
MSRPPRDDLAYGDLPQRWDRDRFERAGHYGSSAGGRRYEEDFRFAERDSPRRRDVAVMDRVDARSPRGQRYEERDRFVEEDRYGEPLDRSGPGGRRRRTDRELFGDQDPRELANLALTPYKRRDDLDIDQRSFAKDEPRPGLIRRQSSLDSFDRRPRYDRDDYRIPAGVPVPLPIRRPYERNDGWEEIRYRDERDPYYRGRAPYEDYRDVEIRREKSVRKRRKPKKSATTRSSSSSSSSFEEVERSSNGSTVKLEEEHHSSHHTSRAPSKAPTKASSRRTSVPASVHESVHPSRASVHESVHESIHVDDARSRHTSIAPSIAPSKAASRHTSIAPSRAAVSIHESVHKSVHEAAPSIHESVHESVHESAHPESVHESFSESVHESVHNDAPPSELPPRLGRKGKTRMPKRLVRMKALNDLGYPFDEEEDFWIVRVAMEKDQIDEVIRISEEYKKADNKTVYHYAEKEKITESVPPPAPVPEEAREHEELLRTEWINPPSVYGGSNARSVRAESPLGTIVTRRTSPARTIGSRRSRARSTGSAFFEEEKKTVVEERGHSRAPSSHHTEIREQDDAIIEERAPSHHGSALVVQERQHRSDRDIQAEIRSLEVERRALRLERDAEERRDLALRLRERPDEEYRLVEYRERPYGRREIVEFTEEKPKKDVLRVEKDRKGRMALVRSAN